MTAPLPCPTLAAAGFDQTPTVVILLVMLVVVTVIAVFVTLKERKARHESEERAGFLLAQQHKNNDLAGGRDETMFTPHKQMNDLQIAKLTAEVELLQNQVRAKTLDEDRIEASKEYHELMVEKTRLEMDSLRLHLLELRKRARTEDWRDE